MTLKDKDSKQGKNSASERLDNLSEERRKLLDAMMDKERVEQETSSSQETREESGSEGSQQNPGFEQNPFENQSAGQGPQNPWANMDPNFFQNMFAGLGRGSQNPWANMGQDPFQNMFGGLQQNPWVNMFQNMFQNMSPWTNTGQNPFQNLFAGFGGLQQNPLVNMFQNMFQNIFQQAPWQNPFQNQGFPHQPRDSWQNASQEHEKKTPPWSPLVPMRASGSKPPFFCVHAILGSAFPYHNLVLHMEKDQPFYGLQAPGIDGKQAPLDRIKEMAALYVKSIRSVQAKGPYYLGGYSFGGWVAFEIARLLDKKGERVNLLAILGTTVPATVMNPAFFERMEFFMQYVDDFLKLALNSALSDDYRMTAQTATGSAPFSPLFQVYDANIRALLLYAPQPCPVKIDLFVTRELQEISMLDTSLGWKMVCSEVETHLVSGNHLSTFHEPHVRDLAEKLTFCLKRARGKK